MELGDGEVDRQATSLRLLMCSGRALEMTRVPVVSQFSVVDENDGRIEKTVTASPLDVVLCGT